MQSWCWKSRQGQDALYKRLRPGKRIRTKSHFQAWKRTEFYCERWQAFGFCNDDFCNKAEGKKGDFCRFSMTLRTVISVVVQIQKVTFCKKAPTFLHLSDIPIWWAFYSMLTTDNKGSVRATEKVAMFLISGILYGRQRVKLSMFQNCYNMFAQNSPLQPPGRLV